MFLPGQERITTETHQLTRKKLQLTVIFTTRIQLVGTRVLIIGAHRGGLPLGFNNPSCLLENIAIEILGKKSQKIVK